MPPDDDLLLSSFLPEFLDLPRCMAVIDEQIDHVGTGDGQRSFSAALHDLSHDLNVRILRSEAVVDDHLAYLLNGNRVAGPQSDQRLALVERDLGLDLGLMSRPTARLSSARSFRIPTGGYGRYGISAGPLFPVYSKLNGSQPKDRVRFVVNFTYWF